MSSSDTFGICVPDTVAAGCSWGESGLVCAEAGNRRKDTKRRGRTGIARKSLVMANLLCPEEDSRALSSSYSQRYHQKSSEGGLFSYPRPCQIRHLPDRPAVGRRLAPGPARCPGWPRVAVEGIRRRRYEKGTSRPPWPVHGRRGLRKAAWAANRRRRLPHA